MGRKILIITVGGSDEPIVKAIKTYKPDFVYFICSGGDKKTASEITVDGEGIVCIRKREIKCPYCKKIIVEKEGYPNIITQSGYEGKYEKVILNDPDDFNEVYNKTKATIEKAKQMGDEIICDFTGGTKTMSSVLSILSAFDFQLNLSFSKGKRKDTEKIEGESVPVVENINSVRVDFVMNVVDSLIARYLYYSAKLLLENLLTKGLTGDLQRKLLRKTELCEAFYRWDNFEYEKAFNILQSYAKDYQIEFEYLMRLLGKTKNSGYESVLDLIKNAERQAYNGFYDNGVARVYRALELLAQIRLKKQFGVDSSSLEKFLNKLKNPEKWERKKNKEGKIRIGLVDDYELLAEFDDPFGKIYRENEKKFKNMLEIRNSSKLAHGDIPITESEWKVFLNFSKNFIERCLLSIKVKIMYPEFPVKIE